MKKLFMLATVAALVCSCSKEEMRVESDLESTLYLSIVPEGGTKASGEGHGVQADDNTVKTLEIFIFRDNPGKPDDGILDTYCKFTGDEVSSTSNMAIQTTTGDKIIYAVANAHRANWKDVNTRQKFEEQTANLADENSKNFLMVGSTEATLSITSVVSFSIRRFVARVGINSIRTDFAGGPYEGMELTDVKAYLINVQGAKHIYNGVGKNLLVLNKGKLVEEDAASCTMAGAIYDNFTAPVTDAGYTTPHYFYCYENTAVRETEEDKFTRLIIEGKLNGMTYYYPIVIKNIMRNNCYSVDIKIKRPGSLDPGTDVYKGSMNTTISIVDWNVHDSSEIEF